MNTLLHRGSSAPGKTRFPNIAALVLLLAALAGCSKQTSKVTIRGSNTIGEELARAGVTR